MLAWGTALGASLTSAANIKLAPSLHLLLCIRGTNAQHVPDGKKT
jgi:hypothetical protein